MYKNIVFGAIVMLMSACGDSEPKKQKAATEKPATTVEKAKPEPAKPAPKAPPAEKKVAEAKVTVNDAGEAELTIEANDAMQFNSKKFTVVAGQKVKLTLKHTGQLTKDVMGHNIVILKPDANAEAYVAAAQLARDNDYFPKDKADQTIAHSKLLGGGESVTIEFVAPDPGTYPYICSYSNHWFMMKGDMVVIAKK